MIVAHLADLHLGYRAYRRMAPGGVNARERDVGAAFRAAVDRIIELDSVDLVLVAGDVFHTVRPSNRAIADAFRQYARLRDALPEAPVVVIAGNHDSPRAVETGSILRLLREIPDITVVDVEARTVSLDRIDTSVLCLPHSALRRGERIALEPDADASTNILMLHGTVTGGAADRKLRYVSEYGGANVETSEIRPDRWDYVALGHYHIATELAPNMWYAGGVERTSTNIWEEAGTEKGFLTFDTEAGRAEFHRLSTRPVIDLPRFSARLPEDGAEPGRTFMEPAAIDESIRERVEGIAGGIGDKIVRLVIENVPRSVYRELDHDRIRAYKADALHFHLDARRPEVRKIGGYGAPRRRRTLGEEVETFLKKHWSPASKDVDTERLVRLARRYLGEAGADGSGDPLIDARTDS